MTCEMVYYVICQKMQTWSIPQLQKTILDVRENLQNSLHDVRSELNDTRSDLLNTTIKLNNTITELNNTRDELIRIVNQRFEGIEGAFLRSFEVGGSVNYYYPVAF